MNCNIVLDSHGCFEWWAWRKGDKIKAAFVILPEAICFIVIDHIFSVFFCSRFKGYCGKSTGLSWW